MSDEPTWLDQGVFQLGEYTIVRQFSKGRTRWDSRDSTGKTVKRSATLKIACAWINQQPKKGA